MDRCTHCNARLLPGDVECRACGMDLISGRMPGELSSQQRAQTIRLAVMAGASLLLLLGGAIAIGSMGGDAAPESVPCLDALKVIQPLVKDHGGEVPTCAKTPPGSTDCWSLAGVSTALLPRRDDLWLKLRPSATGFEITCRSDEDGDGKWALFQANEDIEGLRISASDVR